MPRKPQELNIQRKAKRPVGKTGKGTFHKNPDEYPCPVCGETDFEWGRLMGIRGFVPEGGFAAHAEQAYARVCRSCGNVMTFLRN